MPTKAVTLQNWIGHEVQTPDLLRSQPAQFMQATLDYQPSLQNGDVLPPLWHWLYFLEAKPASELGRDAHPRKGGFLPPVPLPRRMWAGGRIEFHAPLIIGKDVLKRSTIRNVVEKKGRSGNLCFVTVEHAVYQDEKLVLNEEQDIVYREDPKPDTPIPEPATAPGNPKFSRIITPTQVMLFRYSALTFNGHRIHYDVDYARDVEAYDGLVFHGPLTATLLVDLASVQMGRNPKYFEFRAQSPISGLQAFRIEGHCDGDTITLWARGSDNALAMSASAHF
ncbi:MAG: acyl-CoA dehydrogenase [Hyphomicrobiales bacterium]|nr:acyl-CoA dehydrogenase [Hyphomicrobiales bacterium]